MDDSSKKSTAIRGTSGAPTLGSAQYRFAQLMESNKDRVVERATCPVDADEVAKHTSANDCWVIYKGNVYDVTRYLDVHPGGRQHLLDHAGTDLTEQFLEVHPWVNAEFLLKSLYVGKLKSDNFGTVKPSENECDMAESK
ncbi:cytochrome b5-like heme/steroid binding domain-containing protein, putative [Babesia caballi]|uniref:Cytochrome b5-like heme/steroid binding domain-containing protein, putative n=1 Tax=Babesia caballi TaxID=5871 RepID=A0AAV4LZR1_BABCB|nr:cytochrome b5-like heme/steroid binding domain-containing protein, putative [Babesia caballi]